MASLYKTASARQRIVLRAVEGAVVNAAHAHSRNDINRTFARSVAKRAAGTLTAQWPDVLAARVDASSAKPDVRKVTKQRRRRVADLLVRSGKGAVISLTGRALLRKLHKEVSRLILEPKRTGNVERANALIDVCRIISELNKD